MEDTLHYLFSSLLTDKKAFKIELDPQSSAQAEAYNVSIPKAQMGRIIGKNGSVIKAIRLVASIPAKKMGKFLRLNLLEG